MSRAAAYPPSVRRYVTLAGLHRQRADLRVTFKTGAYFLAWQVFWSLVGKSAPPAGGATQKTLRAWLIRLLVARLAAWSIVEVAYALAIRYAARRAR